ncbi:hypothetical protein PTTG_26373 [Puccinia triticina 1-1 BBBD Race 1]|uniref:Uncharacterized protein n=1 Tax=Puccinia triticina (isolate 1-1 / race 1 (BBBD)) TaxID=630390 RepID=A0A180GVI1_PUCT1|nr:hypothetical protein PTTG_26373 [Puccinia triticina 1-1 BBBD Race 1]
MACSIVDFSKAQQRGFVAAYMNVFGKSDPKEAMQKLKGCREHFCQSVTRVKQNCAVINPDEQSLFESKCLALLQPCEENGPTHDDKIDEMRGRFPKIKAWLDWWTMADVESMLFPSRRKMLEDSPNGDDGLPSLTNAQESMHWVYYMFSAGKKSFLAGFSELYAFFKALERDHSLWMRGILIQYGVKPIDQKDVAHSIRWIKPTKRQRAAINDGRPPDTTEALLDCPNKQAKLGRPPNSQNINRALHTTFIPLWLQTPSSKKTDLFHTLVSHFTSRTTNELIEHSRLKTVLTRGSNQLFEAARNLHPNSFVPGDFASCDFFMEILLDPKTNSSKVLQGLFAVQETHVFSCPRNTHNKTIKHPSGDRRLVALKVAKSMFDNNLISYSKAGSLIAQWASSGLAGTSGLQCQSCNSNRSRNSCRSQTSVPEDLPSSFLEEVLIILFPDSKPLPHLYFQIYLTSIVDQDEQAEFMGQMEWPNVQGVTGVWLHDNQINGGYAQMVNPVPGSISGAHPHTSWLLYSRQWTEDKAGFVNESVERIRHNNPKITSGVPFSHMNNLLNIHDSGYVTADTSRPPKINTNLAVKNVVKNTSKIQYIGDNISDDSSSSYNSSKDLSNKSTEESGDKSGEESTDAESSHNASHSDDHGAPPSPPSQPFKICL